MPNVDRDKALTEYGRIIRMHIALDAGALVLLATFLREPPTVHRAKYFVGVALACFSVSLLLLLIAAFEHFSAWVGQDKDSYPRRVERFMKMVMAAIVLFFFGVASMTSVAWMTVVHWP